MAICKDCFHWESCRAMLEAAGGIIVPDDFKGIAVRCKHFVSTADVAPRAEWISVEERLPGVIGKYICCVKNKDGNTWTITADYSPEMKTWFGQFGEVRNTVTHWMPLPEPPDMKGGAQ